MLARLQAKKINKSFLCGFAALREILVFRGCPLRVADHQHIDRACLGAKNGIQD
jgi:hypothetical protein